MRLCFASNNQHKLNEIRPLLEPDFRILSLADIGCADELPETRDTLEGNAMQKAEYVYNKYNIACFADDTGLEVAALNNEPGVYSARFAGGQRNADDNMALLLSKMKDLSNRKARFRTVIALLSNDQSRTFEGIVNGTITTERAGSGGFGYDPVFQPDGFDKTFAEMSLEEKNSVSHRARAIDNLVMFLKSLHSQK